jgi:hypothetical protein
MNFEVAVSRCTGKTARDLQLPQLKLQFPLQRKPDFGLRKGASHPTSAAADHKLHISRHRLISSRQTCSALISSLVSERSIDLGPKEYGFKLFNKKAMMQTKKNKTGR